MSVSCNTSCSDSAFKQHAREGNYRWVILSSIGTLHTMEAQGTCADWTRIIHLHVVTLVYADS